MLNVNINVHEESAFKKYQNFHLDIPFTLNFMFTAIYLNS